jgi:hypothetical protein
VKTASPPEGFDISTGLDIILLQHRRDMDNDGAGEDCQDLSRDTARAGDSYYSAMTGWLTRRKRPAEERSRILWLGRIYDRSLEALIRCLERIGRNPHADRKHEDAVGLRDYLHKDLEMLSSNGTSLVSQTDET